MSEFYHDQDDYHCSTDDCKRGEESDKPETLNSGDLNRSEDYVNPEDSTRDDRDSNNWDPEIGEDPDDGPAPKPQTGQKWLVYGGKGWICGYFLRYVPSFVSVVFGQARGHDYPALEEEIKRVKPDRVLSFIGRTRAPIEVLNETTDPVLKAKYKTIDWLEENTLVNLKDNFIPTINIQKITQEQAIHFTYIGTGCIFSYDYEDPYKEIFDEEDLANFTGSSYSVVKGLADTFVHNCYNVLNVRIRLPITSDLTDDKNLLTKLISYKTINSLPNSMSVLPDVLPALVDMVLNSKLGTINLVNPGVIDHEEILELYKELVNKDHEYTLVTDPTLRKKMCDNRSNCILVSSIPDAPNITESVRRMFAPSGLSSDLSSGLPSGSLPSESSRVSGVFNPSILILSSL